MHKNPTLVIQIDGHTNGTDYSTQSLSDRRAETIKRYLIENNISEDRITTAGFSGFMMLYPNPKNEIEAELNRRVEILVLDY